MNSYVKIIYILDLEKFMVAIIDYGAGNLMSVKKLLIISALKMKLRWTRINSFCFPYYSAGCRLIQ